MKFRKKPVVIEAIQLTGHNAQDIIKWSEGVADYYHATTGNLYIKTLEGVMTAHVGDWVIKGTANEFYPCKPDIFAQIYEPVEL